MLQCVSAEFTNFNGIAHLGSHMLIFLCGPGCVVATQCRLKVWIDAMNPNHSQILIYL